MSQAADRSRIGERHAPLGTRVCMPTPVQCQELALVVPRTEFFCALVFEKGMLSKVAA